MKLGKLISHLENMPNRELPIRFKVLNPNFVNVSNLPSRWPSIASLDDAYPHEFMSYRGFYERLGLDVSKDVPTTVGRFMELCKAQVNKSYHGYKGGEFVMTEDTRIHIAPFGTTSDFIIVGVLEVDMEVLLFVAEVDQY
jgi:hypothetical protein